MGCGTRWVEEAELVACIKRSAPRRGLEFETLLRQELQMYTDGTAATLQRVKDAEKDAEATAAAAAAAAAAAPAAAAAAAPAAAPATAKRRLRSVWSHHSVGSNG